MTTQIATPDVASPPNPDAAQYEALRKELGIEPEGKAPEAEPAPEPEPQPEPQPEPRAKPEHVPYTEHENVQKALREAREQARAAEARANAIVELIERNRTQRPPEAKAEPPKVPDVQEDPIGHFNAKIAQMEAELREAKQGSQQTTEELQAQRYEQQLWGTVQQFEADIRDPKSANHKADYDAACEHLEATRIKQLDLMYPDSSPQVQQMAAQYGLTPQQFKLHMLNQDRRSVAVHALQTGISPAQLYYELAQGSGYQPKAAKPEPQKIIEAAKRGAKAAVTLSGGDGGARKGPQDLSITDLADLAIEDPDAFDKTWEQMKRAGKLG